MAEFFISGHMLSMWNFQAHMPSMSSMWIKKNHTQVCHESAADGKFFYPVFGK